MQEVIDIEAVYEDEIDRRIREELRQRATAEFWKGKYFRLLEAATNGPMKPVAPLNDLAAEIHATAKEKGWYDPPQSFGERVCMMHSELSEAVEDWRKFGGDGFETWICKPDGKPEGWAVELSDCLIRILDFMASYGLDIDKIVRAKMDYNKTRPYRHGGKAL